jgi:hypothetical protein
LATPASASTIGNAVASRGICLAPSINVDDSYAAPAAAAITSFSLNGSVVASGTTVDFLVLRPTTPGNYTVVGKSGTQTLNGSGAVQTFPVTAIAVQPGDVLGWFNVTDHAGCIASGSGAFRGADDQTDPGVGSAVSLGDPSSGLDLNLAAHFPSVDGSGNTNPGAGLAPNAFTLSSVNNTLTYSGGGKTFNGTIKCLKVVGNAATIVAIDPTTKKADRTMVQDNGASGDKLINTLFDPSKLSAKSVAKAETCVDPDTAALARGNALSGDAIQVG